MATRNEFSPGVTTLTPIAACGVGTVAIGLVAERLHVEKEKVAIAALGVGLTAAMQTTGVARHIAIGVAAAGAATVAVEMVRHWTQKMAPPDAPVTHEDLNRAMAAATQRAKDDAATIAALRDEVARLKTEPPKPQQHQKTTVKRDAAPPTTKKAPSFMALATDAQGKKVDAILRQFDEHDRAKLISIYESLPKATVDQMFRLVDSMPVHEAVNFIRNNVLLKS